MRAYMHAQRLLAFASPRRGGSRCENSSLIKEGANRNLRRNITRKPQKPYYEVLGVPAPLACTSLHRILCLMRIGADGACSPHLLHRPCTSPSPLAPPPHPLHHLHLSKHHTRAACTCTFCTRHNNNYSTHLQCLLVTKSVCPQS